MNDRAECAALSDDLAAYALGALDPAEAGTLERHLAGCDACTERLEWLTPAVNVLPGAVEQLAPPPSLRENLMAAVRTEGAAAPAAPATSVEREPWWAAFRRVALRPATAMVALIVLAAGVGAGYLLGGAGGVDSTGSLVKAESLNQATPVSATLERAGDSATLHVQQLPAIGADEVYEVWVRRAGVLEPRSTFVLNADGTAEAAVPGPLDGGEAVLVTREPRGGSNQPTTDPILTAPL